MEIKKYAVIRVQTLVATLSIILSLIFYFLVKVGKAEQFDWIEFAMICVVQITIYYIYFPDGDLSGQKNPTFIANKDNYNDKANKINENGLIGKLRDYCKYEFEQRKERYITNILGYIGITKEEFEELKQKDEKFIKNIQSYEFKIGEKSKLVFFSKEKRKQLYNVLFKKIPVEPNFVETIMSATENNGTKAVKDGSGKYKKFSFYKKIFQAVVIGGILSYITYTTKDGIGLAEIASIFTYLATIGCNAVLAFNAGEKCSKVYKNQFYVNLTNFIDEFNEWNLTNNLTTNN